MMNHKLSLGWSAWHEMYTEYKRKRRLLMSAGARLTRPKLVHAFAHWQEDWDATELAKEERAARMTENERLAAEARQLERRPQQRSRPGPAARARGPLPVPRPRSHRPLGLPVQVGFVGADPGS